jgi:hypothetical protein
MNNYVGGRDGIGAIDWGDVKFLVAFNVGYVGLLAARAWCFARATVDES